MKNYNLKQNFGVLNQGVQGALTELLTVHPDLQQIIDQINIEEETFVSMQLFADASGKHRGQIISGHNSVKKLLYAVKEEQAIRNFITKNQ